MENENVKSQKKHKAVKVMTIILAVILVLVIGIVLALKFTIYKEFPELKGEPKAGKWYQVSIKNAKSSDGSEWHGFFRKGIENKLVVYFFGGGVSVNEYTASHSTAFYTPTCKNQAFMAEQGLGNQKDNNPFKDWSFVLIPYATGDFHVGTGEFKYKDEKGNEKTLYHNGYNNYSKFIEKAKSYVGSPETLLVTGFSAGGFAASLLADDVIGHFPSATNITVSVDSSLLLNDKWHDYAVNVWKAPTEVSQRLTGNNLVLDSLTALHQKRPDAKILFDCSVRDAELCRFQSYFDTGNINSTKANGDKFQKDLKAMVEGLQTNIDGVGIFIWELGADKDSKNTQHTILYGQFTDKLNRDKSIADWMIDAVNGNVKSYGLDLLEKQY